MAKPSQMVNCIEKPTSRKGYFMQCKIPIQGICHNDGTAKFVHKIAEDPDVDRYLPVNNMPVLEGFNQ